MVPFTYPAWAKALGMAKTPVPTEAFRKWAKVCQFLGNIKNQSNIP